MTKRYRTTALETRSSSSLHGGAVLAGIGLLASFLYVRAKSKQAERDNPPEGQFVEVDGVRLHYLERGSGKLNRLSDSFFSMCKSDLLSPLRMLSGKKEVLLMSVTIFCARIESSGT